MKTYVVSDIPIRQEEDVDIAELKEAETLTEALKILDTHAEFVHMYEVKNEVIQIGVLS